MAADAAERVRMSRDEYLAFERASDVKHVLWDGEVYAMAGASLAHNTIVANLVGELRTALRDHGCRALPSDQRVRIPGRDRYVYPDATVVCGRPQLEDAAGDVLLNPAVVVEVLSESTEAFDRGEKFAAYRTIASMQSFVLVSQDVRRVEVFTRGAGGVWSFRAHEDGAVTVDLGGGRTVRIALDEIYAGVETPA